MKIRHIIFVLLVAVVTISWYNSQKLYRWYLTAYYQRFLGEDRGKSIEKARVLFREERYDDLLGYIDRLMTLYPADYDLRRLKGLSLIKTGRRSEGARMVIASLRNNEDLNAIGSVIEILFEEREYADLADILSRHRVSGNSFLLYVHGVSLYHAGRHAEAERRLVEAGRAGKRDYDTLFHLGLAQEKNGRINEALATFESAYELNPVRTEARGAMVRLYRITKQYHKAEKHFGRSP
ncbi:MAG TPA: hypothetical protein VLM75_02525 [Spirochaetota bacterium]|nr:hypothetical protein [Spirochaetota bacterium]